MKVQPGCVLTWSEIDLAPDAPGVYAWYARLVISKADIEVVIKKIAAAKEKSDHDARIVVEDALDRFIFNAYRETPYRVQLRGQLKPKYSGEIAHEPSRSDSLVLRLIHNPERFRMITDILKNAAPWFTAPLYIGMAVNLKTRLRTHKSKIIELRDNWVPTICDDPLDAGFANQVVARNFDPTNLFVHIAEIPVDTGEHNDIENILNRINYPIFGRN